MSGKVALVTGGAQGIGEAIALRLAQDGYDVAILDLCGKEEQMRAVAQKISEYGRRSHWHVGDVSDETSVCQAVADVVEHLGSLDVMVANAGICGTIGKPVVDITAPEWNAIFSVNVLGTMLCYKYAAIQMMKQGKGGRIIGACSITGKQGFANVGAYSASKFAVRGLTHVMSKELKEHNITVNAYAPGIVYTAMINHPDDEKHGGPGSVARLKLGMPPEVLGAKPDTVASIVSYLAQPESHFITGQITDDCSLDDG
ncbi:NAD-P-binding protein [Irpex lacteus]|nr:NAD-P-binding protein [Irpex lacteus]